MESIKFLARSIFKLGPSLGFRYWKIYLACRGKPDVVAIWATKCRWEASKLEHSDPVASKLFEDWAALLSECVSKNSRL